MLEIIVIGILSLVAIGSLVILAAIADGFSR